MDESLVVNVTGGVRLCVPASLDRITPYVLLEQEDWFEDEIRFVRRWLQPGMRAVDVGANYGVYTLALANAVGSTGRVYAFEPTPQTADLLALSLEINRAGHVVLRRAAASARPGELRFRVGPHAELNAVAGAEQASAEIVTVPAVSVDGAAAEQGWSEIDFVKLDVEGHELQVIEGGKAFFAAASPLVMLEIKAGTSTDLRPAEALRELGYQLYRLLPGPLLLAPFDAASRTDPFQLNVFACKPDRAREIAARGLLADAAPMPPVQADRNAWAEYAQTAPYAGLAGKRWPSRPRWLAAADETAYFEGLALFAQSRRPALDAGLRYALLRRAAERIVGACENRPTLGRRLSAARIAWELGERLSALETLQLAAAQTENPDANRLDEPFLSPAPRYDDLSLGVPAEEWVANVVLERTERLQAFSSFYTRTSALPLLQSLAAIPYLAPETERRRQLIRLREGLQQRPEPHPLLCRVSPENLNPTFWCGTRAA